MGSYQAGILCSPPAAGRFITLAFAPKADPREILDRLRRLPVDDALVVGLGEPLVRALGKSVPGLRTFPAMSGVGCAVPSTQGWLFLSARAADHGDALRRMRGAIAALGDGVRIEEDVQGFVHGTGRDLSGFEDGTENPRDHAAVAAAIVADQGAGLDGGSFVVAQRWIHDLPAIERLAPADRDALIGRNLETNEELPEPPASAHVRRAQQEGFDPPAFMLRRSMPYGTLAEHGLYFLAYVARLDAFERMMERMAGIEDGIADGLFRFSRPVSGGYYWCPPAAGAHLDLRALG